MEKETTNQTTCRYCTTRIVERKLPDDDIKKIEEKLDSEICSFFKEKQQMMIN